MSNRCTYMDHSTCLTVGQILSTYSRGIETGLACRRDNQKIYSKRAQMNTTYTYIYILLCTDTLSGETKRRKEKKKSANALSVSLLAENKRRLGFLFPGSSMKPTRRHGLNESLIQDVRGHGQAGYNASQSIMTAL